MFALLLGILAFSAIEVHAENKPFVAIAVVEGTEGAVKGNITFTQAGCGENVHVHILVHGLSDGPHGFHIHEKGDITNGCLSMGGHYNPDKMDHGAPTDEIRHVGDLGNIISQNSVVDTVITDHLITLTGPRSIVGRGVVIHTGEDDLGRTLHPDSKKTGNAGGRAACGIIGIKTPSDTNWPCTSGSNFIHRTNVLQALILPFIFVILSNTF
ncbi:extracellular superoxide dismutase [Cu-Zn] [Condylostylus longicornis]|uniref:extracellular superoxide dismutase [Cu-Zn] n=1 Tax=Condylostylus longicornis TaxID=2530218 RepID=UPI00244E353E|nr:extracellular superoxide dismutase [Cu-Zn] [Condylostylus longicornis]XP_055374165.1 extracellular superoxide dismutase [Cu-Zn] [Condylostylus longicornis]XP_055374166.1 extracellular superoxide dismutase [Cu-Zn] [Condylostylus longicornis]XP_055374167.1 extracellular superoxide dismutase [Cu-Zn] [Condylostylus longicornis]XP_055374168.1 extracellular superoxide dismutase [Cu-Zn] [Condylostylus longicornis]